MRRLYFSFLLASATFFIQFPSLLSFLIFLAYGIRFFHQNRHQSFLIGFLIFLLVSLIGKPLRETELTAPKGNVFRVKIDSIRTNGDLLELQVKENHHCYQAYYRLKSQKEKVFWEEQVSPLSFTVVAEYQEGQKQMNFEGFDYQHYLITHHLSGVLQIKQIQSIKEVREYHPLTLLEGIRRRAILFCQRHFAKPMQDYFLALLFGYSSKSFQSHKELYSNLGLLHLFAISGLQTNVFIQMFRLFLLRIGLLREWLPFLQLPFSFLLYVLLGQSFSVERSLIQALLLAFHLDALSAYAFSLIALLFLEPHILTDVGGLLTLVVSLFLLLLRHYQKVFVKLAFLVLPIQLFLFSTWHPISLPLSIGFGYLMEKILLPLLLISFAGQLFFDMNWVNGLFKGLEIGLEWLNHQVNPGLVIGKTSLLFLLMEMVIMILVLVVKEGKKRYLLVLVTIALFLMTKYPLRNEVTFINVGQGDCILIRDWTGKTVLIDCGGKVGSDPKEEWQERQETPNAKFTVLPYLASRGIDHIDYFVASHIDQDHIGDLAYLAEHCPIHHLVTTAGALKENETYAQLVQSLDCQLILAKAGNSLAIMGSQLYILEHDGSQDGRNEDSIVLFGRLLGKDFLFTGDLTVEGENALMRHYPNLRCDILKLGHHGSKTSSDRQFLKQLQPELAIISVGEQNRYHHPDPAVVNRLQQFGIKIYRTDQDGAVRLTGWSSWTIETVR